MNGKSRIDGRAADELRPVAIRPNFIKHAEGSVLIEVGDTRVCCTASVVQASPKKSPPPWSATTASFPCSETTLTLTLPSWI